MKTVNYFTMHVGFRLLSVDFENRVAVLRIYGKPFSTPVDKTVRLSGLLISRLRSDKWDYEVGKYYSSVNNEEFRQVNPFKLIRYQRDGEIQYYFTVVEDAGSKRVSAGVDIHGNPMERTVFLPWLKKGQYRRYVDKVKVTEPVTQTA